jgi:hypothetical protein
MARGLEGVPETFNFGINVFVVHQPLANFGHLPAKEVHRSHYNARRRRDTAQD